MQPIDIMQKANKYGLSVDFVNHGIASRIGDTIIMNINLVKYPEYCERVLNHEIAHSGKFTAKDFVMDCFDSPISDALKFTLKHPAALSQLLPFGKYKGKYFIDINQILIYIIAIILVGAYLWMT